MKRIAYAVASVIVVLAATSQTHAEGTLDPTFSNDGIVTYLTPRNSLGYRSQMLPGGKIVAASRGPAFSPYILRLLPDGTPDPAFGNLGPSSPGRSEITMSQTEFFGGSHEGFTVSPDGSKIYVAGYGSQTCCGVTQGAIVRLDASGQVDMSFGAPLTPGYVRFVPNDPYFLASEPDGRIAGLAIHQSLTGPNFTRSIFRILPDGSPDSTFANGGFLTLEPPLSTNELYLDAVVRAPDGSYYVNGEYLQSRAAILHVTPAGTRDMTFAGGTGIALLDLNVVMRTRLGSLIVLADGKLMVATTAQPSAGQFCAIARLNPDGTLDSTFGNGGYQSYDLSAALGGGTANHELLRRCRAERRAHHRLRQGLANQFHHGAEPGRVVLH